jgi:N,N'-diacetylbacillosaminyl-diphospho-undecaprenol alpha-1,3-N-acetylgalactosaminyltransferase
VDAYRDCDVFVSPALMEGCSLVVLEALAAGCGVVVTDAPGNRDAVQDGVNGLVCQSRDPQDLARKILAVVRDAGLRERLGAAARRSALAYDWLAVARRYGEAYAQVKEGRVEG